MLVSFDHGLIYLKSRKTAGTSVEMALQVACGITPAPASEETPAIRNARGIVGRRLSKGDSELDRLWFNHMPATLIRQQLGDDIWERSLRVANIRNPFARMVSAFYWRCRVDGLAPPADLQSLRERFTAFALGYRHAGDRDIYYDEGRLAPQAFLRHERLAEDLAALGARLGLAGLPEALPSTKVTTGLRRGRSTAEHYTPASLEHVRRHADWILDRFGYPPDPEDARSDPALAATP